MINIKLIRNNPDFCIKKTKHRGLNLDIKSISIKENERKILQKKLEFLLSKKKNMSNLIFLLKKENKCIKNTYEKINNINKEIINIKDKLIILKNEIYKYLLLIPNIISDDVPLDNFINNKEIYNWGEKRKFNFTIKNHIEIGSINNNIDFELGSKITGKKFVIIKNVIAKINRALIQFMLDLHVINHGYEEIYVPLLINEDSLYGTGQLPKFYSDIFRIEKDKNKKSFYLIPTSEVPLVNLMRNIIIEENKLPIKMVSYTPCFRSEVGSYRTENKGLIRLHQFDKVEIIQFVKPELSFHALEVITEHAENVLKLLKLPYRKMLLCAKDTSFSSCKTYDLEVWFPSKNKYIEVSSCSNTSDFQSRRIMSRFRRNNKKIDLVHILNASGLAVSRTLAALIENYQNKDMSIDIPEILLPYMKKKF